MDIAVSEQLEPALYESHDVALYRITYYFEHIVSFRMLLGISPVYIRCQKADAMAEIIATDQTTEPFTIISTQAPQ